MWNLYYLTLKENLTWWSWSITVPLLLETIHNWSASITFWVALNYTHPCSSSVSTTLYPWSGLQISVNIYQHKMPYLLKNKGDTQGSLSDAIGPWSSNLDFKSCFQSWIIQSLKIKGTADVIRWPHKPRQLYPPSLVSTSEQPCPEWWRPGSSEG